MPKVIARISIVIYFLIGMHHVAPFFGRGGLYFPNNIIGWIFISSFIGIGFWRLSRTGVIRYSGFLLMFIFSAFLLVLPMYFSNNYFAERAIYRLAFIFGGLLFYAIILQFDFNDKDRKNLIYFILISASIQSAFGIFQYFQFSLVNNPYSQVTALPVGCFGYNNVMAVSMTTGIGISLFFLNSHQVSPLSKIKFYFLYIMPFSGGFIILLIDSKLGYVALLSTILLQVLSIKYNSRSVQSWFTGLFIGILIGWVTPENFRTISKSEPNQNDISTINTWANYSNMDSLSTNASNWTQFHDRLGIWKTTWIMIRETPLAGVGYGRWQIEWRKLVSELSRNEPDWNFKIADLPEHPFNDLLLFISEGGLVVFISLIIFGWGYYLVARKLDFRRLFSHLGLISPIFLSIFFDFPFRISVAHWIIFLILIYVYDKPKQGYKIKSKIVALIPALVIPLVSYYNMVMTYNNLQILKQVSKSRPDRYNLLRTIKHPGPLYLEYELKFLGSMLNTATRLDDRGLLQNYIDRAEEFLEHTPHIDIYQGLYNANQVMDRPVVAAGWIYKARKMYPDPYLGNEWLYNDDDKKRYEENEKKLSIKLEKSEQFLINNKNNNSNIIETSSGLQYRVIKNGTGQIPTVKSKIKVKYSGPYFSLDEFNSSTRDGKVSEFLVNELIKGWQEGMLIMKEGSEFEFFIHPRLGYGKKGRRGIPGNAFLIFNVKLIEIL